MFILKLMMGKCDYFKKYDFEFDLFFLLIIFFILIRFLMFMNVTKICNFLKKIDKTRWTIALITKYYLYIYISFLKKE